MRTLLDWAVGKRRQTLFVVLLCSAAALWGLTRLGFDDSYQAAFRSNDACFEHLQHLDRTFGAGDADCIILLESPDMLSRTSLNAVRRMHSAVSDLPEVQSTTSLMSARRAKRVGRIFLPLFPGPESAEEEFEGVRNEALQHPLIVGKLLSADAKSSLIVVRLRRDAQTIDELEPILFRMRQVLLDAVGNSEVTFEMTGIPAIRVETIRGLQYENVWITSAGVVCSTIVAWLLLRNPAAVALVVLPSLVGMLWTIGAIGLAGKNINAVNAVLAPLVMVIGGADSIHLVSHFRRGCVAGLTPSEAIRNSFHEVAGACGLTALTTSCGFFSLLVSDDGIIREFGVFGGIGVCLTFVAVLLTLPILVATRLGTVFGTARIGAAQAGVASVWPDRYLRFVAARAFWLAPLLLVVSVVFVVQASRLKADFHFLENLTDRSESCRALKRIEQSFGGGPLLQVLVEWPVSETLGSETTLQVLSEVHEAVDQSGFARMPVSIVSVLQTMPGRTTALKDRVRELEYLPQDRLRSLVDESQRMALVVANAPDAGAAALREPLDRFQATLAEVERRHPGYRLTPTGFAVVSTYRAGSMITDLFEGLSLEVFVVIAVMAVALRSKYLGFLSLPSNLFPLLATAAIMHLLGLPLQYATVLALNICLGIAVDDTVHFLSRYRHEMAVDNDRRRSLHRAFRDVVPVMATTTLLMLSGFGAGLICSIPTVFNFSLCACLALILAFASELIVLPTMICWLCSITEWRNARRVPVLAANHPDSIVVAPRSR